MIMPAARQTDHQDIGHTSPQPCWAWHAALNAQHAT